MPKKQTILITGGCGFIGTNMVRLLIGSGEYRLVNLDALTYAANPLSLEDLEGHPDYKFVRGNINDRPIIRSISGSTTATSRSGTPPSSGERTPWRRPP